MPRFQHHELRQPGGSAGMIHDQEPGDRDDHGECTAQGCTARSAATNRGPAHRPIPPGNRTPNRFDPVVATASCLALPEAAANEGIARQCIGSTRKRGGVSVRNPTECAIPIDVQQDIPKLVAPCCLVVIEDELYHLHSFGGTAP